MPWNKGVPVGGAGYEARQIDNDIRDNNGFLEAIINADHVMVTGGDVTGYHRQVTLVEAADIGTGATGVPILGAQTAGGKAELTFTDEDDNDIQMTDGGNLVASYKDRGDPAAADQDITSLTADNEWHDLDLSVAASIDSTATALALFVYLVDDVAGSLIQFRKKGNSNDVNRSEVATQVGGTGRFVDVLVPCNTSQVIQYKLYTADTNAPTAGSITVKGWHRYGA